MFLSVQYRSYIPDYNYLYDGINSYDINPSHE